MSPAGSQVGCWPAAGFVSAPSVDLCCRYRERNEPKRPAGVGGRMAARLRYETIIRDDGRDITLLIELRRAHACWTELATDRSRGS